MGVDEKAALRTAPPVEHPFDDLKCSSQSGFLWLRSFGLARERSQIPARLHRESVVLARLLRPTLQSQRAGQRDHRAVVRAKRQVRVMHIEIALLRGGR